MTTEVRLHYFYDPLCGWCYAVAPLVKAARTVMPIMLYGGGMIPGARRQKITPDWKAYVGPNDRQITQVTGQLFGFQLRQVSRSCQGEQISKIRAAAKTSRTVNPNTPIQLEADSSRGRASVFVDTQ